MGNGVDIGANGSGTHLVMEVLHKHAGGEEGGFDGEGTL